MNKTNNMINNYGIVKLERGSILYHTSDEKFNNISSNIKPLLFCTFHPLDYGGNTSKYIHKIILKKNIFLFFMINTITNKPSTTSSLNEFINNIRGNMVKTNILNILYFIEKLKNKSFDGWFSSIENGSGIEVALMNNGEVYELYNSEKIKINWNILFNNNNPIKWGNRYQICTLQKPATFILNIKFKKQLALSVKKYKNKKLLPQNPFQVVLNNASFYFFDKSTKISKVNNIFNFLLGI